MIDADLIVDRRRLRRKLALWRVIGVVAVAALIAGIVVYATGIGDVAGRSRAHIARISISGLITDDRAKRELIEKVGKSDAVKAVIVAINSPGGTTVGGEALYEALRSLGEKKPVVAHIGTVGASAGYMVALATDHIVARRSALTGSIGVIIQFGEASKLLETIGISMDEVKSSPLKATPNFYKPASEEARQVLKDVVDDSYDWFVGLVRERRNMTPARATTLADGRIYSGAQALENGLIDAIGGEDVAISWLETERDVAPGLPVRDWKKDEGINDLPFSAAVMRKFAWLLGDKAAATLGRELGLFRDGAPLDGLISVWQPSTTTQNNASQGAPR
ncbi:protease-4 [Rhodobium orientis]|nr:signal peptide peptidase SppA [Rhodobium orientis]MBB4305620.1 protease-4 [Rhodobium orientis]